MGLSQADLDYYKSLIETDPVYAALKARLGTQRNDVVAQTDLTRGDIQRQLMEGLGMVQNQAAAHGALFSGALVNAGSQQAALDATRRASLESQLQAALHGIEGDLTSGAIDATQRLKDAGIAPPAQPAAPSTAVPGGTAYTPAFKPNPAVSEEYQPYGVGRPVTPRQPRLPRLPAQRGLRPAGGF